MKQIPLNQETTSIARRVVWFEPPEKALADPVRFMAYAMAHAVHEDMKVLRRYVSDADFQEALDKAPPGIIDPRSWAYWNSKMGRYPAPPRPVRRFGSTSNVVAAAGTQEKSGNSLSSTPRDLEAIRRDGRAAWLQMRQHNPHADLEQIRRRARENWLAEF